MATMDIFEGDAFSIIELTRAVENLPFKPTTLSASGLFGDRGVRTRTVVIESRDGTLSLIPFSERGSAFDSPVPERRDVRAFLCRQFKKQDVIWASEIQGIRSFGQESEASQVQVEVARRLRRLRSDAEATFDVPFPERPAGRREGPKDGATVVDYFTEFAITPAADRGGSVCLNTVRGVSKWMSRPLSGCRRDWRRQVDVCLIGCFPAKR